MIYNQAELKEKRRSLRNNSTNAEKLLWKYLKSRQIENVKFRRQFSINNYVVDFYTPEIKLAIEADGDTHFKDEEVEYDRRRQRDLESFEVTFLRFTNTDVIESTEFVVENIRMKVMELLSKYPPPTPPWRGRVTEYTTFHSSFQGRVAEKYHIPIAISCKS